MSMKAERGTKRTCQSASCGARFYDLNRDPIVCPICGTIYEMMTTTAVGAVAPVAAEKPRRPAAKKPELEGATPGDTPDIEADDAWREELEEKTGSTSIPVVEIDGEIIRGYDPGRMRKLLESS